MFKRDNSKGFTLIELLVVIAIIGLLASIVLASLNSARKKSRDARRMADLQQLKNALELYSNDNNGHFPDATALTDAPTALSGLVTGGYIAIIPGDPLGGSLTYNYMSDAAVDSEVYCMGGVLESTIPTPSTTCRALVSVQSMDDYTGGPAINYSVGN